jgi:hypothetical protein
MNLSYYKEKLNNMFLKKKILNFRKKKNWIFKSLLIFKVRNFEKP